jgi:hypothetical protein
MGFTIARPPDCLSTDLMYVPVVAWKKWENLSLLGMKHAKLFQLSLSPFACLPPKPMIKEPVYELIEFELSLNTAIF